MFFLKNHGVKEGFPEAKKWGKDIKERTWAKSHRYERTGHVGGNAVVWGTLGYGVWESRKWGWRGRQGSESERALGVNVRNLKFILNVMSNYCRILCIFFSYYLEQFLCF